MAPVSGKAGGSIEVSPHCWHSSPRLLPSTHRSSGDEAAPSSAATKRDQAMGAALPRWVAQQRNLMVRYHWRGTACSLALKPPYRHPLTEIA